MAHWVEYRSGTQSGGERSVAGIVAAMLLACGGLAAGAHAGALNTPFEAAPPQPIKPWAPAPAHQVSIERHVSVRVSPAGSVVSQEVMVSLEQHSVPANFAERKIGKCVNVGAIGAVQGGDSNQLLLFMRDSRLIAAELEKTCTARDFYSGFYIARNSDGRLCVRRDALQARSGARCRLRRMREWVALAPR